MFNHGIEQSLPPSPPEGGLTIVLIKAPASWRGLGVISPWLICFLIFNFYYHE